MIDDPRLKVMTEELNWAGEKLRDVIADDQVARASLARLDAVDPLRRPVNQDREEAAYQAFCAHINDGLRKALTAALAAADRVQAPAENGLTLTRDDLDLTRQWFDSLQDRNPAYLDEHDYQLAKRIMNHLGVRVPHSVEHGLAATKSAEKPDFPPWMRLLQLMSQWVLWESASDPQYSEIKAAYDATFPEPPDVG